MDDSDVGGLIDLFTVDGDSSFQFADPDIPLEELYVDESGQSEQPVFEETSRRELIDCLPTVGVEVDTSIPLSGLDFSDSLTSATADVGVLPSMMQPWESGPMSQLFSSSSSLNVLPKGLSSNVGTTRFQQVAETEVSSKPVSTRKVRQPLVPSFLHVVCNVSDTDFLEARKASMKVAIDKFCKLILMNPLGFELGAHLGECSSVLELEKEIIDWLEAAFSMKAPNTVNKRANALLLYAALVRESLSLCHRERSPSISNF